MLDAAFCYWIVKLVHLKLKWDLPAHSGALKMTDRKMTDRDIAGGGKCRTGIRRTKV